MHGRIPAVGRTGEHGNPESSDVKGARLTAGAFFVIVALTGCASMVPQTMELREAWPAGVPDRVELDEVPFFPQRDYQCGPAALATTLVHSGVSVTPDDLVHQVYLPARQGSLQAEMQAAPRRYGRVSYPIAPRLDDLLREVAAGNPVIVLQDNGAGPFSSWHYAVVAGFDYPAGELLLRSGKTRRLAIPFTILEYTWKKSRYWAMVTLPPDRIPVTATESGYLAAVIAMARVGDAGAITKAYTTFLERWPGNVTASIALANKHYEWGALDDAEAVLRRAAARHPDSVAVLNNLAQTVSDQGRNDEALALIERVVNVESPFAASVRETRELILKRRAQVGCRNLYC
jgi:Peptidase_C39 like family/Tetratricopeptide repeat